MVSVAFTPLLVGSQSKSEADVMTCNHEAPQPARVVFDFFTHREVGRPALATVLHVLISSQSFI